METSAQLLRLFHDAYGHVVVVKQQLHGVPLDTFYAMCEKMNREHSRELISEI